MYFGKVIISLGLIVTTVLMIGCIDFENPVLGKAVSEKVKVNDSCFTQNELDKINELSLNRVKSLKGIEYLENLVSLNLEGDKIDIEPLLRLKKLKKLYIKTDIFNDNSSIILPSLQQLSLDVDEFDADKIRDLIGIESLRIEAEKLKNIESLSAIKGMKNLHIRIDDLSFPFVVELNNLEQLYIFCKNQYLPENLYAPELKSLLINCRHQIDVGKLPLYKNLSEINLSSSIIKNIDGLSKYNKLKNINLCYDSIFKTAAVKLPSLDNVKLRTRVVNNLDFLSGIVEIKELNIESNVIDLNKPVNLPRTNKVRIDCREYNGTLSISSEGIEEIEVHTDKLNLSKPITLHEVRRLELSSDYIDFKYLDHLGKIEELSIITDKPLENISLSSSNLRKLYISTDEIEGIGEIRLPNLEVLEFHGNNIYFTQSLLFLNNLESLTIRNNWMIDLNLVLSLSEYKNLSKLVLDTQEIIDLNALMRMNKLESLSISSNQTFDCSLIKDFRNLRSLEIKASKLENEEILSSLELHNLKIWSKFN